MFQQKNFLKINYKKMKTLFSKSAYTLGSVLLIASCLLPLACSSQATISPAIGFGRYKHYTSSETQTTSVLNINAGYQFLKEKNVKPLAELSIHIPLLDNNHPVSFAFQPGIQINLTDRIAITAAAGPEIHIQQLYKYPIDQKDSQQSTERHRWQPSAKLRIQQQFQDDKNAHLYMEISYDQRMPLIKFGMHIIITKKDY
jgi:hypothetical protein